MYTSTFVVNGLEMIKVTNKETHETKSKTTPDEMENAFVRIENCWQTEVVIVRGLRSCRMTMRRPGNPERQATKEALSVEFYLYPTVGTVLIHSAKPELTE